MQLYLIYYIGLIQSSYLQCKLYMGKTHLSLVPIIEHYAYV